MESSALACDSAGSAGSGWDWSAIVRHGVINFFMLIILAPLAWVLHDVDQVARRFDARRFLAAKIRLHALRLCLREDRYASRSISSTAST